MMKNVLKEMIERKDQLSLSWKDIAVRTGKDQLTVMRQLSEEANPTVETLEQYADVLDGVLHFVPTESMRILRSEDVSHLRRKCIEQAEEIGAKKKRSNI